jgi:hypothetical protein
MFILLGKMKGNYHAPLVCSEWKDSLELWQEIHQDDIFIGYTIEEIDVLGPCKHKCPKCSSGHISFGLTGTNICVTCKHVFSASKDPLTSEMEE